MKSSIIKKYNSKGSSLIETILLIPLMATAVFGCLALGAYWISLEYIEHQTYEAALCHQEQKISTSCKRFFEARVLLIFPGAKTRLKIWEQQNITSAHADVMPYPRRFKKWIIQHEITLQKPDQKTFKLDSHSPTFSLSSPL